MKPRPPAAVTHRVIDRSLQAVLLVNTLFVFNFFYVFSEHDGKKELFQTTLLIGSDSDRCVEEACLQPSHMSSYFTL